MTPTTSSPRILQEIRRSIYATAASGIQVFSQDPDFAPDRYRDDEQQSPTRLSQRDRFRLSSRRSRGTTPASSIFEDGVWTGDRLESENPFDDSRSTEPRQDTQNPFDDSNTAEAVAEPEPPYHIFSQKQKWFVIAIIGVAGLFSGLSSNIFFPSLDAIARVNTPLFHELAYPPNSILGSKCQLGYGLLDHHILLNHSRHLSPVLGLNFRCVGPPSYIHRVLFRLYCRQHRPQFLPELCGPPYLPGTSGSRQCLYSEHR